MAIRLNGKETALNIRAQIKAENEAFIASKGIVPCLAVVLVGANPASVSYVTGKKQACDEIGFKHIDIETEDTITEDDLLKLIDNLNKDKSVHGILVQLPLPKHIDEDKIIEAIDYKKDVDGFHPFNVGALVLNRPGFVSCTPQGVLALLDCYNISTVGKKVVIVGRSNIVGKPLLNLLIQKGRDATVCICNTRTPDLKKETLDADIVIVATGHPNTVTGDMIKEGAVVVDVGVNRIADATKQKGWRLVGDCDFKSCEEKASYITPVPGGVGPMTITMLMNNTLIAAKMYGEKI